MYFANLLPEETALGLLQSLVDSPSQVVAVDTETTGLQVRDGRDYALGVSVAWRPKAGDVHSLYLPFRHKGSANYQLGDWLPILRTLLQHHRIVFHNAMFDIPSLRTLGLDDPAQFYCTIVLSHLVNENMKQKGLDALAKYWLNDPGKQKSPAFTKLMKLVGWAGIPATVMSPYAAWDADMTVRLFEYLQPKLKAEALGDTWRHKQDFINRCLLPMAERGVRVNVDLCHKKAEEGTRRMEEIIEVLGIDPAKRSGLEDLLLNQLGLAVVKRTPTGAPCFDKEAMKEYDFVLEGLNNPTARLVKEFRGWQKAVSSNYRPYVELLSPDGRLRCSYKLHGTVTGRMSCEKPNLQQIPRHTDKAWNGEVKQCFEAEDGYELWEFDYAQLELRLGTHYAKVDVLKQVFKEGRDIFTEMAKALGLERQDCKTFVYLTQYGGGTARLSKSIGVSINRAQEIRNEYRATYPGFTDVSNASERIVKAHGKIQYWSGRYRHFEYPKDQAHKAFNSIIQGGAADIVERTMLRCVDQGFNTEECRMLLQVHDSIVFEIRKDLVADYVPRIQACMEAVPDFDVKFAVEGKVWGQ